jgi:hypothetical protein
MFGRELLVAPQQLLAEASLVLRINVNSPGKLGDALRRG